MLNIEDFIWKEHKANNISTNPLEEWYCIVDLGNGNAKKYSIKPQYPSKDGICINSDDKPEYYIFFESNGSLATEKDKKSFTYKSCNYDGYIFEMETFIRVFTSLEDAKNRAYYNYKAIFGYCLSHITDDVEKATKEHKVIK